MSSSLCPDAEQSDHLPHFSVSSAMNLANSPVRGRKRNGTDIGKPRLDSGTMSAGIDLAVEPIQTISSAWPWGRRDRTSRSRREAGTVFRATVGMSATPSRRAAYPNREAARSRQLLACSIDVGTRRMTFATCPPNEIGHLRREPLYATTPSRYSHQLKARWRRSVALRARESPFDLAGLPCIIYQLETVATEMKDA